MTQERQHHRTLSALELTWNPEECLSHGCVSYMKGPRHAFFMLITGPQYGRLSREEISCEASLLE